VNQLAITTGEITLVGLDQDPSIGAPWPEIGAARLTAAVIVKAMTPALPIADLKKGKDIPVGIGDLEAP
jgi:hypothetical protein